MLFRSYLQSRSIHKQLRWVRVLTAISLIGLLAVSRQSVAVHASDSDLDLSFGQGGIVTTDFLRAGVDQANSIAIQTDGKIVVAGSNDGNFAVARYNADGSLDTTFGTGGKVITALGNLPASASALALQADGKIVVVGDVRIHENTPGSDFALVRYNTDGSLDSSFGDHGRVTTNWGGMSEGAGAVVIQPSDGKIIAAGSAQTGNTQTDFALARYNPDGSLDISFGGDGKVTTDFNGNHEFIRGLALQPDGRIVAAGTVFLTLSTQVAVTRYNVDGGLDTSFGTGGRVSTVGPYSASSVTLQSDGKIVVAGGATEGLFDFVLLRYHPNGNLDADFGTGGVVRSDIGTDFDIARSVVVQADGKILAGGGNLFFFILQRYNSNGIIDSSFGDNGTAITSFNPNQGSNGLAIALQNDGRIVAAGYANTEIYGTDFALARYNSDGSPDSSFHGDGKVTTDWPGGADTCDAMVIQPDGKIILAGSSAGDFAVARYNPDGVLDSSFGDHGRVVTDFSGLSDFAQALALQSDGKIIAAGVANFRGSFNSDFALARYNTDGSLDTTFDTDGKVTTDFAGDADQAHAVAVQPDGKIIAAGGASFDHSFALARYNSDGSLDTSFDGDGKVTTSIGISAIYAIVIQPDDRKIVAAGYADSDFALARYNPDGSLDSTFDIDGTVVTDFSGRDLVRALALQSDGKIVAAGFTQPGDDMNGMGDFALARYKANGHLDNTFDDDGKLTTNLGEAGSNDQAYGVAIQHDGKIVAAGFSRSGSNLAVFAVARYSPAGVLDAQFGGGGIVTTAVGTSTRAATSVAIQSPDGKIVAAGETFKNGTGTDFALIRYGGGLDTIPPTITCPAPVQAVTTRPRDACGKVLYPMPVVTDNQPGTTVACLPPSGSCFPVGNTTVTCTATDAAGNTSMCNFAVTVYDVVLQSDSAQLLVNSFSGDYSFCCPELPSGQSPLRGRGESRVRGGTITLTHNAPTFKLLATIDAGAGKGSASFKYLSGNVLCPIQDRNIYDNLPLRCGSVSP